LIQYVTGKAHTERDPLDPVSKHCFSLKIYFNIFYENACANHVHTNIYNIQ